MRDAPTGLLIVCCVLTLLSRAGADTAREFQQQYGHGTQPRYRQDNNNDNQHPSIQAAIDSLKGSPWYPVLTVNVAGEHYLHRPIVIPPLPCSILKIVGSLRDGDQGGRATLLGALDFKKVLVGSEGNYADAETSAAGTPPGAASAFLVAKDVQMAVELINFNLGNLVGNGRLEMGILLQGSTLRLTNVELLGLPLGISAKQASRLGGRDVALTGVVEGVLISEHSQCTLEHAVFRAGSSSSSYGLMSSYSSSVNCISCQFNNYKFPVYASFGGSMILSEPNVMHAEVGFQANHMGVITVTKALCEHCGIGFQAAHSSHINAPAAAVTGCHYFAFHAMHVSQISARSASYSRCKASSIGFFAEMGSVVDAKGSYCKEGCGSISSFTTTNSIVDAKGLGSPN